MKIKILLLWTFVMLLSISINAQSLSPRVISSAGGFFAGGSATLSVTVAEMTMVQTFVQPANILTQGFQQPEQFTTAIEENDNIAGEVSIFPNPTGYSAQSGPPIPRQTGPPKWISKLKTFDC